jgi:hypothetical protein
MKTKIYKLLSIVKHGLLALALAVFTVSAHAQATYTFNFTGFVQTVTLSPANYLIECWGGNGGDVTAGPGGGGRGGYTKGEINIITPGTALNIYVGGKGGNASGSTSGAGAGGWNGGGGGGAVGRSGAGGGGASDVRLGGTGATNRIIVAGGGGGAAYYNFLAAGGNGGGIVAQNGDLINSSNITTTGGGGAGANGATPGAAAVGTASGTATGGGGGGSAAGSSIGQPGTGGGQGGSAGINGSGSTGSAGGGGGGFAGGAGGVQTNNAGVAGGGGSSFIGGVTTATTAMFGQTGYTTNPNSTGNGWVRITELCSISLFSSGSNSLAPSICSGQSLTLTTNGVGNYNWSTGNNTSNTIAVTPTVTTIYTLSAVSPSACVAVSNITVIVSQGQPTLSIVSSTNQICLGRTVTLTASGALSYSWTNGITNGASFQPSLTQVYNVTGQNACGTASAQTTVTVAPLSVTAVTSNSVLCAGQTTTLTAASAVNGYTWQPFGFTGSNVIVGVSASTIYTVTASDGTCSGTSTVSVNALPIPTIVAAASATNFCQGNSATLTASGAVSYVWQPGNLTGSSIVVSPLIPTLYSVVGVASNSCFSSASQVVIVNSSPTLNISSSDPIICGGSTATLLISGASTYTWSNNSTASINVVSPSQSTVYTVIGADATTGCISNGSIALNVFSPTLSITGNTAVCAGSSATLQASGANTYQWSNGFTGPNNVISPTSNSIITVSALTNSGSINCPSDGSVQIVILPNPTINIVATKTAICRGESANFSSTGAQTYTWSTGATSNSIVVTSSLVTTINYSVSGTNSLGCINNSSVSLKVNSCTGIDNLILNQIEFAVFPNPNNGSFSIKANSNCQLSIFNELGQLIQEKMLTEENNYSYNVYNYLPGVYMIQLKDGQNSSTKKIIVTK